MNQLLTDREAAQKQQRLILETEIAEELDNAFVNGAVVVMIASLNGGKVRLWRRSLAFPIAALAKLNPLVQADLSKAIRETQDSPIESPTTEQG